MTREVEAAKKRLSSVTGTDIDLRYEDIRIHEHLERDEFSHIIEETLESMMESIVEAEQAAGLEPGQIDLVLTTGGTSLIPAIRDMLHTRYGAEKVRQRDTFTSVATGLAIVAQYL